MNIGGFIHKLFGGRDYKVIDGILYIKEGFGDWERLDTHVKREHPELYDEYIENERRSKK